MRKLIAITGPTGAGKSTLTYGLSETIAVPVCQHTTTRNSRTDDIPGFYEYITNPEYYSREEKGEFLFASGDGKRFYGVELEKAEKEWRDSDIIIVNCGYKDIETIHELRHVGIEPHIVVLTFEDFEQGIVNRTKDRDWDLSIRDERIIINKTDYENNIDAIDRCAHNVIYTDNISPDEVLAKCILELENHYDIDLNEQIDEFYDNKEYKVEIE